jgi:hypothetical protein
VWLYHKLSNPHELDWSNPHELDWENLREPKARNTVSIFNKEG